MKIFYGQNIYGLEQKIINWSINKLKQLPNLEMYLYRNYLNCNFHSTMEWAIEKSSFKGMNLSDYSNSEKTINQMLEIINLTLPPASTLPPPSGMD